MLIIGNPKYFFQYNLFFVHYTALKFFNTTLCRIFLSSCNSLYETDVVHQQDVRVRLPK